MSAPGARHAGRLTARELCHVRAAAIVRGEEPDAAAPLASAGPEAAEAWRRVLATLERAHVVTVHAADTLALAERCAGLATIVDLRAADAEARRLTAAIVRDALGERDDRRADAALTLAGIRAWCADAAGIDVLDLLAALAASDDAPMPDGLTAERAAAWWQDARRTLADAEEMAPPTPEAVSAEGERWRRMAAAG